MKRPKYHNHKTIIDGVQFDSKKESKRWTELQLLERAREISDLRRQVRLDLHGRDGVVMYSNGRVAHVIADFAYVENGQQVYEDTKGFQSPKSKLQHAILRAQGIKIRIS